jgi:hypothetical protein
LGGGAPIPVAITTLRLQSIEPKAPTGWICAKTKAVNPKTSKTGKKLRMMPPFKFKIVSLKKQPFNSV